MVSLLEVAEDGLALECGGWRRDLCVHHKHRGRRRGEEAVPAELGVCAVAGVLFGDFGLRFRLMFVVAKTKTESGDLLAQGSLRVGAISGGGM